MITPEQFINNIQKQILKLQEELAQAHKDIEDFEKAAIEWKNGYKNMERDYKIKLANANQIIDELQKELDRALRW